MRVAFHTLGCKVNQYETEAMKEAFVSRGAVIVGEDEEADVYIVNTCTVTNIADRKSRQYIRRMKGINPDAYVVVTGCYAQVESEEVAALPEVNLVIGNGLKNTICEEVYKRVGAAGGDTDAGAAGGDTDTEAAGGDADTGAAGGSEASGSVACEPEATDWTTKVIPRAELTHYEDMGLIVASESGMTRAYIKIQEGCDRFCAYCLIPFARGPVRSRPPEDIVREAVMLLDSGYKELVLTGINTALYGTEPDFHFTLRDENGKPLPGMDKYVEMSESELAEVTPMELILARLDAVDRDFRIRLSSLEPTVVDKHDVEKIIRFDKLCHHLHLSAQSGSTNVLKSMNRRYTQEEYLDIVKAIREYDPLYGLTTDIIVGFSGETEEDFRDSLKVVAESEFARVHSFRYSVRKGTTGADLPDVIPGDIKSERSDRLITLSEQVAHEFNEKNFGHAHRVLTEERDGEFVTGYTGNYIRVYIEDPENKLEMNEFYNVELIQNYLDGCKAVVV